MATETALSETPGQSPVIEGSPAAPPARRRGRPRGPGRPRKRTKITPAVETAVAAMGAAGASVRNIASVMDMAPASIQSIMHRPSTQELIQTVRLAVKQYAMNGVERAQSKAWKWVDELVETKDAKGFDYVVRGLLNQEKIAASVCGEASRVDARVAHEVSLAPGDMAEIVVSLLKTPTPRPV